MRTKRRIGYFKLEYFQGAIRHRKNNWKYQGIDYEIKTKSKPEIIEEYIK